MVSNHLSRDMALQGQPLDSLSPELPEVSPNLILLVEDNITNQKIIGKQLNALGYAVETVTDGQSAVQAFVQKQYDLILMDCQLPKMNGFEATMAIRQHEQTALSTASVQEHGASPSTRPQHTVIIAMTASDLTQDQERAIASGMNDYIKKPIQREMLEALLEQWMQKIRQPHPYRVNLPRQIPQAKQGTVALLLESYLDLRYLHQLSDGCPEFELELLHLFLKDSHHHLGTLRQAIAQQDYPLAEQAAHHLRGSSANIGAKSIQFAAVELEQQAHQRQFQSIEFLLDNIDSSLRQIQAYVTQSS